MSEFLFEVSWVAVPSRHALGAWVAPRPNGAKTVSPADLSICLPLRAHRARTRRGGLPHPHAARRVASSAHLGWFPGYSIGSRRVRAAIKEPSQP